MTTHQSVLLHESIEGLAIKSQGIYIDGTFGRGGHSREILKALGDSGYLIAIDKDPEAIDHARKIFANDKRFSIFHASYAQLSEIAKQTGVYGKVNGILLDLGMSSPQIDNPERGFSFIHQGPLDMRMDTTQNMDAATFINTSEMEEMAQIFKDYGEERFARRIARAIVEAREKAPITTTMQLAEIVKAANPKWEKHKHPATRVFQAIRIYINQELAELKSCLEQSFDVLAPGGRLVVISFHSLEDRIVKQFMRFKEQGASLPREIPLKHEEIQIRFKRINKAIKPDEAEIKDNLRARSAVLRIGEKQQ
ncbi:16S rRNA (cytosine(1402)-N(4))-methyltransferase RsmH [Legionella israelensis]|uniref:Ribosomal RNA small subunit methyltransferase H n=1 Tax=Legionella israelensis TaxID=454 RepID=A0A0W0VL45_9GAMM|nr:16S rRNA (cytosine(1402)-N(4))-methyltransferase RsmH [Legionella israelensis]KTD20518.1 S-adenosylmethyl transferase MraW [Legionella israelensis]QBR83921.1 16S rRNA (cytosine(1402)-N(4))-methyltransferase RsmH [Legionella israelensis]QBS10805.1 16S rRNA (cytosine(1402)-N(4))-methyltransferase RsmH [Legionella israelensis]SCX85880.1 16S rRNA (cytosine1402-N4)-methyltransferase [Legionella israelensis DSM 19235]STX57781.1 S-adenosylmethyl transferase MraW [Legionella israelensis]